MAKRGRFPNIRNQVIKVETVVTTPAEIRQSVLDAFAIAVKGGSSIVEAYRAAVEQYLQISREKDGIMAREQAIKIVLEKRIDQLIEPARSDAVKLLREG